MIGLLFRLFVLKKVWSWITGSNRRARGAYYR